MKVTIRKTEITTNTTSWEAGLVDENSTLFATMSGKVDSARPFGDVSLTVHNQSVFQANKESARLAYAQFTSEFNVMVATIDPILTTNEEGEIVV